MQLSVSIFSSLLLLFVTPIASAITVQDCNKALSKRSTSPQKLPSLDELIRKIWLVHATYTLPHMGIIRINGKTTEGLRLPLFRSKIHTYQGALVHSHGSGSWEDAPFVVVFPLKSAQRQLFNLMPNDTTILGDFRLSKEAVVVVPEGTVFDPGQAQVRTYNPKSDTLRNKVNEILNEVGASRVDSSQRTKHGFEDPQIEGRSLIDREFYRALFEQNPNLEFGYDLNNITGAFDSFLQTTSVYEYFANISNSYSVPNVLKLRAEAASVRIFLEEIQNKLAPIKLPPLARNSIAELMRETHFWIELTEAEIYFQERYGRTLFSSPGLKGELQRLIGSSGRVIPTLKSHIKEMSEIRREEVDEFAISDTAKYWLQILEPRAYSRFLEHSKLTSDPKQIARLKYLHAIEYLTSPLPLAEILKSGALKDLNEIIPKVTDLSPLRLIPVIGRLGFLSWSEAVPHLRPLENLVSILGGIDLVRVTHSLSATKKARGNVEQGLFSPVPNVVDKVGNPRASDHLKNLDSILSLNFRDRSFAHRFATYLLYLAPPGEFRNLILNRPVIRSFLEQNGLAAAELTNKHLNDFLFETGQEKLLELEDPD